MRANRRRINGKRVRQSSTAAFKSLTASAFKHPEGTHPHVKGSWDGYKSRYEAIDAREKGGEEVEKHNKENKTPPAEPMFSSADDALDTTQDLLTAGGLTPGGGIIPDAINTGISLLRGGYAWFTGDKKGAKKHAVNASVNAATTVPLAGLAVGTAKLSGRALDIMEGTQKATNVLGGVKTGSSYVGS